MWETYECRSNWALGWLDEGTAEPNITSECLAWVTGSMVVQKGKTLGRQFEGNKSHFDRQWDGSDHEVETLWHKPAEQAVRTKSPRLRREAGVRTEWGRSSSEEWVNEGSVAQGGNHLGQLGVYLSRRGPLFIH